MADVKISELSAAAALADANLLAIAQGAATNKLTIGSLREDMAEQARWSTIATSRYTSTPPSTSQITMSDTTGLRPGLPIRFSQGSGYRYAIIHSVSTDSNIVIHGVALNTGAAITDLGVGRPEMVVPVHLFAGGAYGAATTTTLINDQSKAKILWLQGDAHLVEMRATHDTADGSTQPKVNAVVGGDWGLSLDTSAGIQLSTAGTWVASGAAAASETHQGITRGEALEIGVTAAGGGGSRDLTVILLFVME